jgi:hypothetical protein
MMPSPNMEDASALDLPDSLPAAAWDRNAARRALDVRRPLKRQAPGDSERYAQAARSEDVRGRLRVCASDQGPFISAQV